MRYNRSMTKEPIGWVAELADAQWGLVTTAQAQRGGITRLRLARLAETGLVERVGHGVYGFAGGDRRRPLRAAWLALDPARTAEERLADLPTAGVVSHASAAAVHQFGDLLDDLPEFTYATRRQTRRAVRLHRAALPRTDITVVDGLPVTTVERTVADLVRTGHDLSHVAQIASEAARRGTLDTDTLADRLEPLARRNGQSDGEAFLGHLFDITGGK